MTIGVAVGIAVGFTVLLMIFVLWPKKEDVSEVQAEPKIGTIQPLLESERDLQDERKISLAVCSKNGFKPSGSLPTIKIVEIRSAYDIAGRLHAIKMLVLWLLVPIEELDDTKILSFIKVNDLEKYLTLDEQEILKSPRDDQANRDTIGWKFENVWSLAWYFGYDEPEITGQMMTGDQMGEILANHTCSLDSNIESWLQEKEMRTEENLVLLEDLFYCLHNAIRSAQLGGKTVPQGFDPILNGGVIHERRHSFSWMINRNDDWDDTDLST